MNLATRWSFAVIASSAVLSPHAHANYLGLGGQLHSAVTINGQLRAVYRIYAVFDNPDDYLTSVAGTEILGPMTIKTRNLTDTALGSNFVNVAGGTTAPSAELIGEIPDAQWDTFATIGVAVDDGTDQTGVSPGFPTFISGNTLTTNSAAWFTPGYMEQARAGGPNGVTGTFYNSFSSITGMGVLLAQLTVNAGSGVKGTAAIGIKNADQTGGVSIPNQTFNVWFPVPAPSALALLGGAFASIAPRRRR